MGPLVRSLVVVQDPATGAGLLPDLLDSMDMPAICVSAPVGGLDEAADAVAETDLLVLLGGPGSLVEGTHAWRKEIELVRSATARGTPVLGICFGAQLISVAMGGGVRRGQRRLGWYWTQSSSPDGNPAWSSGDRFYVNGDYAQPPSEADIWSRDADGVVAFACGSAVGVQCHPEVTPAMVHAWAGQMDIADPHALARSVADRAHDIAADARQLLSLVIRRPGT